MADLKEIIRNYVLENKDRFAEADEDGDGVDDITNEPVIEPEADDNMEIDASDTVSQINRILDASEERVQSVLANVSGADRKLQIIDAMVDYLLRGFPTSSDLPPTVLRDFFIKKFSTGEMNTIDEMSTTAGAPAPATKYAFKVKKK